MKWIINYPGEPHEDYTTIEAETKEKAIAQFLEKFVKEHTGHFDVTAMKEAIMKGLCLDEEDDEFRDAYVCYAVPFCLPKAVKDAFGSQLLLLLNEIEILYHRKNKITKEYLAKVYQLTHTLYDLEQFHKSKSILHIRLLAERLIDHSPNQSEHFAGEYHSIKSLLTEAFLADEP